MITSCFVIQMVLVAAMMIHWVDSGKHLSFVETMTFVGFHLVVLVLNELVHIRKALEKKS